ncbi:MAG TPA: molybdopterin molybdenumtransferase MoeA, partial [Candidatus Methanoperedenaceae archaeon]|nr:molybdopterin molybdenumtransferase MoeA [Candidatus Methanoperedenaceae archaeon]
MFHCCLQIGCENKNKRYIQTSNVLHIFRHNAFCSWYRSGRSRPPSISPNTRVPSRTESLTWETRSKMAAYSYASKSLKRYFKYANNSGFIKQTKIPSPKDDNNMLKLFKELTPVHVAEETFMKIVTPINRRERLSIEECSGRVLAEDVIARTNVPHYKRAAMDGYALQAEETLGASRTSPALLNRSETIGPQTCVRVHTGSPLPDGADAVIMIEDTEAVDHDLVEIRAQVHPYENVGEIGEDIQEGEFVFREGHLLRPVDISVLASLRLKHVTVHQKPIVSIIPTGDELIPRNRRELPEPGEIIETNTLMTELYAKKW